ncbi:unnamed protein product [Trichogramma brassicae]|uniref:Uncharacterized protein n=1 Tax=Trichogramma brassicae TaxID=86971 RepID=A0A6H5IMQ4_9HYME|nr:unnamed protein product [Trichogramma brassicae]
MLRVLCPARRRGRFTISTLRCCVFQGREYTRRCTKKMYNIILAVASASRFTGLHFRGGHVAASLRLRDSLSLVLAIAVNILVFVARSGYRFDRRVGARGVRSAYLQIPRETCHVLLRIYDRRDLDYVDEVGFTHFHAACGANLVRDARAFLDEGADPNCSGFRDGRLAAAFASRCRSTSRTNVANLLPNVVDLLLDRGADLSKFVFPTASRFNEGINKRCYRDSYRFKVRWASTILVVAERVEERGYELTRSDALTIMKLLAVNGLIKVDPDDDEMFERKAMRIMIKSDLSLYDLTRLRPGEEEKRLAYRDYFEFTQTHDHRHLHEGRHRGCLAHPCETMARGFFRRWALHSFLEMIRYRLLIECCEIMIIDESFTNKDLWNVCLRLSSKLRSVERDDTIAIAKRRHRVTSPSSSFAYAICI